MARKWNCCLLLILLALWAAPGISATARAASDPPPAHETAFPKPLDQYEDPVHEGLPAVLKHRAAAEPFNLAATLIFFAAIVHTFLASKFMAIAHAWEHEHDLRIRRGEAPRNSVHHGAELFHFLGEVEVIFGLWVAVLVVAILFFHDWQTMITYISYKVNFTEPVFVVVIMTLAATRPILKLSEMIMASIANLFGGTLKAWWFTILTAGPLLCSQIGRASCRERV